MAEVVAIGGAALMLVLGLVPYDRALDVLSNPAPWTIATMFIVMGALVRTGALDVFTAFADRRAQSHPRLRKNAADATMGRRIFRSASNWRRSLDHRRKSKDCRFELENHCRKACVNDSI